MGHLESHSLHVSRLLEEAEAPRETREEHVNSTQKGPGLDLNPGHSAARVLKT